MNKIILDKLLDEQDKQYGEVFQRLAEGEANDDYMRKDDRRKDIIMEEKDG